MSETHCGADMIAIEFPEIYDGVSAYICERCGQWQHRWPDGHPRHARTALAMRVFIAGCNARDRRAVAASAATEQSGDDRRER